MKEKILILLLILALAVLLIVAAVFYNRLGTDAAPDNLAEEETASDSAENPAPDITVTDRDGNAVALSDLRGKPVILNFWASWCGPCKNEMPDFEEAYLEYGEEIQFLMVNCTDGYQETVEGASAFIDEAGYTFPVYFDTDRSAASTYGASSIPMTFFIDREGNLAAYAKGMLDRDSLQKGIDKILPSE